MTVKFKYIAETLWDLLRPPPKPVPKPVSTAPKRRPAQERYDQLVRDMKREHGLRVRRWRSSTGHPPVWLRRAYRRATVTGYDRFHSTTHAIHPDANPIAGGDAHGDGGAQRHSDLV